MSLGPAEILVIFVVALLVFGPSRLPEVGRQVGRGIRELRKFQQTLTSDLDTLIPDDVSHHAEPAPSLPPVRPAPPEDPTLDPTPDSASDSAPDSPSPEPQSEPESEPHPPSPSAPPDSTA